MAVFSLPRHSIAQTIIPGSKGESPAIYAVAYGDSSSPVMKLTLSETSAEAINNCFERISTGICDLVLSCNAEQASSQGNVCYSYSAGSTDGSSCYSTSYHEQACTAKLATLSICLTAIGLSSPLDECNGKQASENECGLIRDDETDVGLNIGTSCSEVILNTGRP